MAVKNAAEVVGAPLVAGVPVIVKGSLKKKVAFGNTVTDALNERTARRSDRPGGELPPPPATDCYLAVTATEVVAVETGPSLTGSKAKQVLARLPRAAVTRVALDKHAMLATVSIDLADGQQWAYDVQRSFRKDAEALVAALSR